MKNISAGTLLLASGGGGNPAHLDTTAAAIAGGVGFELAEEIGWLPGETRELPGENACAKWKRGSTGQRGVAFTNGVVSNVHVESHDMSEGKPEFQAVDRKAIL